MVSKKSKCIIVLFLGILMMVGAPGNSIGATEEEGSRPLMEGAKSEGKLVLYTTQPVSDSNRMIKKFEEKYPFVKVEMYRAREADLLNKTINEAKARKYTADVIEITGFGAFTLKKADLYTSYVSPESRTFPEGFKDPEGNWTSTYVLLYVIGYNTNLISRKEIPETYEGFLDPRWKGRKIGFRSNDTEWFANMMKIMGEKKGLEFFRKFAAQELDFRSGMSLITDLIVAGEFPVGSVFPQSVEDRKNKGAPVDWVGVSPTVSKLSTIGVAAHAPHPNVAKLYIDFCLSREGQAMIASTGRLPARPNIDEDKFKAYKGLKIYPSDTSLGDKLGVYSKQLAEVFKR